MTDKQVWKLFFEIHTGIPREGPGHSQSTRRAYAGLKNLPNTPDILDIGCGPGLQTLDISFAGNGKITAIDNHAPFISALNKKIKQLGLSQRIKALKADMFKLPFEDNSFDLIWAEGSIYNIGFEQGLTAWKPLLKENGYIAVTEVSWLKQDIPAECANFWQQEYLAIKDVQQNLSIIRNAGYQNINHFTLPESAWWDNYYIPLEVKIKEKLELYNGDAEKTDFLKRQQYEIDMYHRYSEYYGYVFYIMQKQ